MLARALLFAVLVPAACKGLEEGEASVESASLPPVFVALDSIDEVSRSPLLRVGSDESLPLYRVRGAVFFNGGIAIANSGGNEVLILDESGALIRRQGGRGTGPGEYMTLAGVAHRDGGLVTWDAYHRRLTLLDSDGQLVGDRTISGEMPPWTFPRLLGATEDIALLEYAPLGFAGEGAVGPMEVRQEVEFIFIRLSDGEIAWRVSMPGEEQWAARSDTGDRENGGVPIVFGRRPVAAVAGGKAYLADTDSLRLRSFDGSGKESAISLGGRGVPALADWERLVRDSLRRRTQASPERLQDFRLALLESLPARNTLPAFSDLLGGSDGRLWLRAYPTPVQTEVSWLGLNHRHEVNRIVRVPVAFEILDFAEDRVLVLERGEYGEELIAVFPIER